MFFNKNGDTIFYHPNSEVGTTWRLFTFKDSSFITAKIEKKSWQMLLNVFDSVIEYSLVVKNYDSSLSSNIFNNYTLKISKNYGAIGLIYEDILTEQFFIANLCGVSKYKLGYNYLTQRKIFDFEIGDEFHIEEISFNGNPDDYQSKIIKKVIDKRISIPNDTVIYKTARVTYKDYFSSSYIDKLIRDTVLENYLIKDEDTYVKDEPIINANSWGSEGNDVKFFTSTSKYAFYSKSYCKIKTNDSCWTIIIDCPGESNYYMEGCGLFKFNGSLNSTIYRYEKNMVYYKKGVETWGVPFNNLSANSIEKIPINIYPNPITKNDKLVVNAPIYLTKIEILNMIGEVILTANNINKTEETIDIDLLKSGSYIIRLTSLNNAVHIKLLLIK